MTTRHQLILAALSLPLAPVFVHAGEAGKMKREVWTGISGGSLQDLRESNKFYQVADVVETISGSEAQRNWAENYGQRLRAYIIAPESGDYTFWIAGDDHLIPASALEFKMGSWVEVETFNSKMKVFEGEEEKFPETVLYTISI